jgi:benzoate membrane transport protein
MVITFLLLTALPALGRRLPPLIGALLVGAIAAVMLGRVDATALGAFELVRPVVHAPVWSWAAMFELVVPLAITVLVVQNGQRFAVVERHGPTHDPQPNKSDLAHLLSFAD